MDKTRVECIRTCDPASQEMIKLAQQDHIEVIWDRQDSQSPHCKFGVQGICCKNCSMGPCRITKKSPKGVCGASADIIVARNLTRAIAAGAAAHSDHGRPLIMTLRDIAQGKNHSYQIKDIKKLKEVAQKLGVSSEQPAEKIAQDIAKIAIEDYGKQDNLPTKFTLSYVPNKRIKCWKNAERILFDLSGKKMGILPRGIDREIVDILHRTHIGVDNSPLSLLVQGLRTAIGDGWGGSLIATEIQDILFGTPSLKTIMSNLGVIEPEYINIIAHGHEPILSEKLVELSQDQHLIKLAQSKGAKGINIIGMCCTGNELLMRQSIPVAGNVLQQELAIMTGAIEAVVVDVQCIYPSLGQLAECFHTKFISTSEQAGFPKAIHIQFDEQEADKTAEKIITLAIEAFPHRDIEKIYIPKHKTKAIVGFSTEQILSLLGGTPEPLINAISNGQIKGIAGMVGCNNPKVRHDYNHTTIAKELIKKDILVIGTGCWAIACAKAGLMNEEARSLAGSGLKRLCESLNIPPILHMGSCVDCSRMLTLAGTIADYMDVDISDLPIVGSAPEWMSEKAISIGTYFIASGIPVHLWPIPPISGSNNVLEILTKDLNRLIGGYFFVEQDPLKAANIMEQIIMDRRADLGI